MAKTIVRADSLADPTARAYSHGVRMGNLLFLAGQTGIDANRQTAAGDFAAQTRQAFANMETVLKAAGGTLDNLVTMTVFITDMRYGNEFVKLRGEILKRDFPASALIGVSQLAPPNGLIEIQAIAALDG
jgi:2-iminobutanoate/2-iminopropanoate deaminase